MSDPAPARPSARGSKGSAIDIAIVLLIGAALGGAFEMTKPSVGSAAIPESAPAPKAEPSSIYDLPPIVTNLAAPQEVWIRLEGSIVFDPKSLPHPESVAGELGEDILSYLRTVSLKQLEGPTGLENLRQDLNERAATRTGGKAREFVIHTMVMQ
jgi:flagellar FliL protein